MSLAELPVQTDRHTPNRNDADLLPGLDTSVLAAIAAGLGQTAGSHLIAPGPGRRWTYVIETEQYEAVVIAWPPGAGLRMHDHAGSSAAIHVLNGQLRERYLDPDGRVRVRWLSSGQTTELPGSHVHEVINLDDHEVVSVHVYSPPIRDDSFRTDNEIDISRPATSV